MWRSVHSCLGLFSLLLLLCLATSGAVLAIYPLRDSLAPEVQTTTGLSVADVVHNVLAQTPDLESLTRTPSGSLIASYLDASGTPQQTYVDASTGDVLGPVARGPSFYGLLKDFHRSLLLGDTGRVVAGVGAGLMTLLSLSGMVLMISRMGGVARLLERPRGNWAARLHTVLTRLAVLPFLLSSVTGVYIVLTAFELVPVTEAQSVLYPESTQGLPAVAPGSLHALAEIPFADLRSLTFPFPDDTFDVFTVATDSGVVVVDQFTGDVLERVPATLSETIYGWIYALHTGDGMAWVGMILGLAALCVPVIAATGIVIWWRRTREGAQRIKGNQSASQADAIVLVGSETGGTWGFARSLHRDLTSAGHKVHVAPMNAFRHHYGHARRVLFLAATYGNGHAPASANRFLSILAHHKEEPAWSYAVLGFGDRAFPHFCQFAKDLDADLSSHGWQQLMAPAFINRQSTQAFATWGHDLAEVMGSNLSLSHEIQLPETRQIELVERALYGVEVQAPTAILKFHYREAAKPTVWDRVLGRDVRFPLFSPTDLLGILPPGSQVPRYYSVSSAPSNDEVEICVRKQIGGACSSYLHDLPIGGEVECFVRPNPDFSAVSGTKPVIMVGAGTGIAPFVGMIRSNARHRDFHLFWGGREPASDFLYRDTLEACCRDNRLASLTTAFSRVQKPAYVQDRLREKAAGLRELVRRGASVMVAGGDAMAHAVVAEFDDILRPIGMSVQQLKSRGFYLEDIF